MHEKTTSISIIMKKIIKLFGASVLNIGAAVVLGIVLLTAVYSLPVEKIDKHVAESAVVIQQEGKGPNLSDYCTSQLDNYTDSIILMEAAIVTEESALINAMNVYHGGCNQYPPNDRLVNYYLLGKEYDYLIAYPRYWHGYLIFVKPLMLFMNYQSLRILNTILQFIFLLGTCCLLIRRGKRKYLASWILIYLMLMPFALGKCLTFSDCYYIFMLASACLLLLKPEALERYSFFVFLNIGIAVAFFDFLTYPIATFGIPMVIYLMLAEQNPMPEKIKKMISNGAAWCFGYGGMWVSKWVAATLITGNNVFDDGFKSVAIRASKASVDGSDKYSELGCIYLNYRTFFRTPVLILAIAVTVFLIVRYFLKGKISVKAAFQTLFPYFVVSLAPMVWYAFATNHSVIHHWFTNKACAVTLLAFLFGLTELVGDYKVAKSGINNTDAVSE